MKRMLMILLVPALIIFFALSLNDQNGNGQLNEEKAQSWAEKKCGETFIKVTEIEGKGYKVICSKEFQAIAGEYMNVVMLGYSNDPNKPFKIYVP